MGKLLTILGITEQSNLPEEILTAESLITGMQFIYQNSPEGEKKEALAKAIAETIRLTIQQIKGLPLTPPKPTFVIEAGDRLVSNDGSGNYQDILRLIPRNSNVPYDTFDIREKNGRVGNYVISSAIEELEKGTLTLIKAKDIKTDEPRVLTGEEMKTIYGADWEEEISLEPDSNYLEWVSPLMDIYFGQILTPKQIEELNDLGWTDIDETKDLAISLFMTTLNPKFKSNEIVLEVGDRLYGRDWNGDYVEITRNDDWSTILNTKTTTGGNLDYEKETILRNLKNGSLTLVKAKDVKQNAQTQEDFYIFTEEQFRMIYGEKWRSKKDGNGGRQMLDDATEKGLDRCAWTETNDMDYLFGQKLTPQQVAELQSKGDIYVDYAWYVGIMTTTLSPYYFKVGDVFDSTNKKLVYEITDIDTTSKFPNVIVIYNTTHSGTTVSNWDNSLETVEKIRSGHWVKRVSTPQQTTPTNPQQTIVQVGDIFKHATEPAQETWEVYKIENDRVSIKWGASRNSKVEYQLQDVIDYINNGVWIKINNQQSTPTPSGTKPLFEVDDWVITDYGMIGKITDCNGTAPNYNYDAVKSDDTDAFVNVAENTLRKIDLDEELKRLNVKVGNVFQLQENDFLRISEITTNLVMVIEQDGNVKNFAKDEFITFVSRDLVVFFKEGDKPLYKVGDVVTWITDQKNMTVTKIEIDFDGDWYYYGTSENGNEEGAAEIYFEPLKTKTKTKPTAKKTIRQSPEISANDVKAGTKKKGLDGNMWVAKKTMSGYNQWKKIK